jgi:hypothetical protein
MKIVKLIKKQKLDITITNGGSQDIYYNLFNKQPINKLLGIDTSYTEQVLGSAGVYEDNTENQRTYNFTFIDTTIVYPPSNRGNAKRYDNTLSLLNTYSFNSGFLGGGPTGIFYYAAGNKLVAYGINSNSGTGQGVQYLDLNTNTYSSVIAIDPFNPYIEIVGSSKYAFYVDNSLKLCYFDCDSCTVVNTGKTVSYADYQIYEYDSFNNTYIVGVADGGSNAKIYKYDPSTNNLTFVSTISTFSGRIFGNVHQGNYWYLSSGTNNLFKLSISTNTITTYTLFGSPTGTISFPYEKLPRLCIDTDRNKIIIQHGNSLPPHIAIFDIVLSSITELITNASIADIGITVYDSTSKTFVMSTNTAPKLYTFYYDNVNGTYNNITLLYQSGQLIHDMRSNGAGMVVGSSDSSVDYDTTAINLSGVSQTWPVVTVNGTTMTQAQLGAMLNNNLIKYSNIQFQSDNRHSYLYPFYFASDDSTTDYCQSGISLFKKGTAMDKLNVINIKPGDIGTGSILGGKYYTFKLIPSHTVEHLIVEYDQMILADSLGGSDPFDHKPNKKKYSHASFKFYKQ